MSPYVYHILADLCVLTCIKSHVLICKHCRHRSCSFAHIGTKSINIWTQDTGLSASICTTHLCTHLCAQFASPETLYQIILFYFLHGTFHDLKLYHVFYSLVYYQFFHWNVSSMRTKTCLSCSLLRSSHLEYSLVHGRCTGTDKHKPIQEQFTWAHF